MAAGEVTYSDPQMRNAGVREATNFSGSCLSKEGPGFETKQPDSSHMFVSVLSLCFSASGGGEQRSQPRPPYTGAVTAEFASKTGHQNIALHQRTASP